MILANVNWASIIISAIITLVLSGVLIPILTAITGRKITKYLDDKEEAKAKAKAESDEALEKTIDKIIEKHTEPIDKELSGIKDKLGKVADGTQDTLRDRILSSYYKCLEKGYRTEYDIENVNHMNRDYLALDGNTFVAECMEKFKNIPTQKEFEIIKQKEEAAKQAAREAELAKKKANKKQRAKKQILNESK